MMLAFFHLYFAPWRRFREALARRDIPVAAARLNQIRWIVMLNLVPLHRDYDSLAGSG